MRAKVSVTIPEGTTADQLAAVASLADAIAAARWEHLARSFSRPSQRPGPRLPQARPVAAGEASIPWELAFD